MAEDKHRLADETIRIIEKRLNDGKKYAVGWGKVVCVVLSDIDVTYCLRFAMDGTCTTEKFMTSEIGSAEPEATIICSAVDIMRGIVDGKVNPLSAILGGKIKVEGNINGLKKLLPAFG